MVFPGQVFVELRTSRPVMTCEGSDYPNHVNLRQTGGVSMGIFELELGRELRSWPELVSKNPCRSRKIGELPPEVSKSQNPNNALERIIGSPNDAWRVLQVQIYILHVEPILLQGKMAHVYKCIFAFVPIFSTY